jgi:epoxyqueuosine reductase
MEEKIKAFISEFMKSDKNTMELIDKPAFSEPAVGFSHGDDELYTFYKQHIDPEFYKLPSQWLEEAYGHPFDDKNISVISWVLPHTEDTKSLCREQTDCPVMEWQMARVYGEKCNQNLAKALEEFFRNLGYEAIAPMCSEKFSWGDSDRFFLISNWSERHTAYISGLGTFGLCDGLISIKGKAVRYGSIIVNYRLKKTKRSYSTYNEYCMSKDGCTACIRRCPAGAISSEGHNKEKCIQYHKEVIAKICHDRYGYDGYSVCGLCQTGVPCESNIPNGITLVLPQ